MKLGKLVLILISCAVLSQNSSARTFSDFSQQVIQRAPFIKARVQAYTARLALDPSGLVINEFSELLNHYMPGDNLEDIRQALYDYCDAAAPSLPAITLKKLAKQTGVEQRVNDSDSNCWNVDVALSESSQLILAVWQDERNGVENPDIWGQFFDLSLNPLGNNFRVHSGNSDISQAYPSVAALSDGGFVVVWEDDRLGGASIYGRLYKSDRTPVADDFAIAQTGTHLNPDVAAANGSFTVTWLSEQAGDYNVFARQYDNAGSASFTAFSINDDLNKFQWFPKIAMAPGGEALIAWEDKRDTDSNIYAQRLRADGSKRAGNFRVDDSQITSKQWQPAVAAAGSGFVVTWEDYRVAPVGIYAQWLDASMLLDGNNVRVDDVETESLKENPAVALNADGGSTFAWQDSRAGDYGIFARSFDADKQAVDLAHIFGGLGEHQAREAQVAAADNLLNFFWMDSPSSQDWQNVYTRQLDRNELPVELAFFKVSASRDQVECRWSTASEDNNLGFHVQRRSHSEFQDIGFVPGHGTTQQQHNYHFVDANVTAGTFTYRLKQVDTDGQAVFSQAVSVTILGPQEFRLYSNVPNPFNPTTTLSYTLPQESQVQLSVYNIQGHQIKHLVSGVQYAGRHSVTWDGTDDFGQSVASGIYVYKLTAGNFSAVKKMLLAH